MLEAGGECFDMVYDAGIPVTQLFVNSTPEDELMTRGGHMWPDRAERGPHFQKMFDDKGVTCLWSTEVKGLVIEDGAVKGIYAEDVATGAVKEIHASKGVIVGMGGFINNPEMVAQYYAGCKMTSFSLKQDNGAGIKMLQVAGGQMTKNFSISVNEGSAENPKDSLCTSFRGADCSELLKVPLLGGLLVDRLGKRFMNEQAECELTMFCGEALIRAGGVYYAVTDRAMLDELSDNLLANYLSELAISHTTPQLKSYFTTTTLSNIHEHAEQAIADGYCWKADSLEELAEATGLPHLAETVERYNGFCETGADEEMFKPAHYLRAIATPPYYVIECVLDAWITCGGIKTDGECRVLTADYQVVPGLYAIGADCDAWSVPYFQGGSASGFAIATGYLAGKTAALS